MLYAIAKDTWKFYTADVDPTTHLPLDNLGPGAVRGEYTSAANIGVYLWAVVAAHNLGLIRTAQADSLVASTLKEVQSLKRTDGFLYQWYDTTNGKVLLNPGMPDCSETAPIPGYWKTYADPQSGKMFNVPHSFGLNDLRWAQVQARYATKVLHYPVWGLSPSSTPDDSGNYSANGTEGLLLPPGQRLSQGTTCATEDAVTPHASIIALPLLPRRAYANIEALGTRYPGIYSANGGFYDAVNPKTGSIGHRRLVLDQSMIMAALDDTLRNGALQRYFARDAVSWAARLYLSYERMSIH